MAFLPNVQGIRVTGSLTGITSITVTGNTRLASLTANTLNVTGVTRLDGVTADTLTVTGNTRLASLTANTLTVTGNTILASVTANTLTVTGNTILAGLTATTISAGTYSNLPNTLYTGNGALSGNRLVDIGGNQLYFSGADNTNALMINTTGVGIKTSSPNYSLEVGGTVGISGIFNQGNLSVNTVTNNSFVHGSNNIGRGQYTHVEGFGNSTAQTGYRLGSTNLVNGVITVKTIDLTSVIFSNDYLVIDDRRFDNVIGINIFKVKSVSYDIGNDETYLTLDDTSLNTTNRFIFGILRTYQFASSDELIYSNYSHSEGYNSISVGDYSHAEGSGSTSMGFYSHAEGALTVSSGDYSHSEGFNTKSFGSHSHAEGNSTYTLIDGSHAEGLSAYTGQYGYETEPNIASGTILIKSIYGDVSSQFTDTGGKNIYIYDDTLFDNVYGLKAFRVGGISFNGTNTVVTADFNLNSTLPAYISPIGNSVPLYADKIIGSGYSHSEGISTKALGYGSHAQGSATTSVGRYSFATGVGTTADLDGMVAVGKYNTLSDSDTLFVIGNGDESGTSNLAVFRSTQITFSQPLRLTSNNPLTITSLPNSSTDSLLLSVDGSGLVSSYNISNISNIGVGSFLPLSGGTVTGATIFTSGLSANTISGGTYLGNGSGLTGVFNSVRINNTTQFSAGANTFINFSGVNISIISGTGNTLVFSASTSSPSTASGDYLPLSGGTVTGGTIFQSGVTANTISEVNYVNFKTSPSVPNPTGGTLYYDSGENALSYKPLTNQNDVTVNLGQESLIRIYNNLGYQINNGQVLHITGATGGVPTVALANASKLGTVFTEGLAQSSGVATHNIPNEEYGFMTNFGVVRDLNTTAFTVGQEVFLSDTVDGGLTNSPDNIAFTSRISTVGYCLESNATTGKILVSITNENQLQSLTQQEVNVLLGNTISTGAYFYTGATTASSTTINVSPMRGWIVINTYEYSTSPLVLNVYYSGGTNLPVTGLTTSFDTYFLVNSGGTLYQQTTYPTPQERRNNIFLGRVVHPNKSTILNVEQSVDYDVSPLSSLRDLWVPLKLINEGVVPSYSGANLSFKTSSGTFWGNGIGWATDELNPNSITVPAYSPAPFYYTTKTGGTFTTIEIEINTTKYDVGGVAVNVPGSGNYTTQRIFMSQSGVIRVQYGQEYYSTLAKAIAAIPSETFVTNPDNALDCILIGLLTVKDGTVDLSNINDAVFTFVSKFGEILGGTGGIATTSLQQAYNNSIPPEITTDSTLGALSIKNGTGSADNVSNIFEGLNSTGVITSFMRGDGLISGSSVAAVSISATTWYGLPSSTFTGGTVNGATNFTNGLSANTIQTTGDVYVGYSGAGAGIYINDGTYSARIQAGNITSVNRTLDLPDADGTFIVTINNNGPNTQGNIDISLTGDYLPLSGGTVSGNTVFQSGLTANTISATTYQNVNAVTGGTYNSVAGVITLSGTGNVNGNTITGFSTGSGGLTWQFATASITASTNNGYITTGTTSIVLPTTASLGSTIEVVAASDNLFTITQNTNQFIRFGIITTTPTSGTLVSQNNGDSIRLVCTSANTIFTVVSSVGTLTLN